MSAVSIAAPEDFVSAVPLPKMRLFLMTVLSGSMVMPSMETVSMCDSKRIWFCVVTEAGTVRRRLWQASSTGSFWVVMLWCCANFAR